MAPKSKAAPALVWDPLGISGNATTISAATIPAATIPGVYPSLGGAWDWLPAGVVHVEVAPGQWRYRRVDTCLQKEPEAEPEPGS